MMLTMKNYKFDCVRCKFLTNLHNQHIKMTQAGHVTRQISCFVGDARQ